MKDKTIKLIELLMSLEANDTLEGVSMVIGEGITNEKNWEIVKQIIALTKE